MQNLIGAGQLDLSGELHHVAGASRRRIVNAIEIQAIDIGEVRGWLVIEVVDQSPGTSPDRFQLVCADSLFVVIGSGRGLASAASARSMIRLPVTLVPLSARIDTGAGASDGACLGASQLNKVMHEAERMLLSNR